MQRKELKFKKKQVKHVKEVAKFEIYRNNILQQELCCLRQDFVQFSHLLDVLNNFFSHWGEGSDDLEKHTQAFSPCFAVALLRELAGVTIPPERIYGLGTRVVIYKSECFQRIAADPHGAFLEYTKRIQCGNSNTTTGRTKDIYMHEQWWIGHLGMSNNEAGLEVADVPSSSEMHESDSSDIENPPSSEDEESTPNLEHVLNYLNSFDMANGLRSGKVPAKKKRENASHKQHRSLRGKNTSHEGSGVRMVMECQ